MEDNPLLSLAPKPRSDSMGALLVFRKFTLGKRTAFDAALSINLTTDVTTGATSACQDSEIVFGPGI